MRRLLEITGDDNTTVGFRPYEVRSVEHKADGGCYITLENGNVLGSSEDADEVISCINYELGSYKEPHRGFFARVFG